MNRRQFLYLLLALAVLGGAGLALFWQDIAAYRATEARIGAKLFPALRIADVAEIRLEDGSGAVTLARGEQGWIVRERGGYRANFQDVSELLVKLAELKVTQVEQVPAGLLARVGLARPGEREGAGTLVELKDAAGKPLARLLVGKKVLKRDPLNPLPAAKEGVPAGRYVLPGAENEQVVVVSDPLNVIEAKPGKWLAKDFFRAERIRALQLGPEGGPAHWRIARKEEWGQWRFADGAGELDASAAVAAVNKLANLSFTDVVADPKPEEVERALVAVAETFDQLTYTVKLAKRRTGDDYELRFTVTGNPPRTRTPEKGEKAADKERRDKEFAETLKRLEERLAAERALAKWTYLVAKSEVEPLLRDRAAMTASKNKGGKK